MEYFQGFPFLVDLFLQMVRLRRGFTQGASSPWSFKGLTRFDVVSVNFRAEQQRISLNLVEILGNSVKVLKADAAVRISN